MKKRLKALEAKVAQEGLVLTESQLAALEKAKSDKEAHGEFGERMSGLLRRPGYVLRRQHEGGRPHLPADLHRHSMPRSPSPSSMIARRPSPRLISSMIAVVPFYDARGGEEFCRVLTDRGTEYCGNPEHHEYREALSSASRISTIRAPRPRARKRMASSSASTRRCSMSSIASPFARRSTSSIADLQVDLDRWVQSYNEGKAAPRDDGSFGKTPMQNVP